MGAMSAMAIGIATAAMTALSSFSQSQQQSQQQKEQASALQAKASATRKQTARKGRVEAENYDRQKSALRREFQETQGRNRSLLAAGNVDMGGGSALDVSLGNIERFAADVGENAYQKALKQWETAQEVKNINYQAATLDAQGSYLKKTAGNLQHGGRHVWRHGRKHGRRGRIARHAAGNAGTAGRDGKRPALWHMEPHEETEQHHTPHHVGQVVTR